MWRLSDFKAKGPPTGRPFHSQTREKLAYFAAGALVAGALVAAALVEAMFDAMLVAEASLVAGVAAAVRC